LSIAVALGLPPIVFDLGAQADRVKRAGYGVVFDPTLVFRPEALNDALLKLSVHDEWAKRRPLKFVEYNDFVKEYYATP
jgi:O-antigen biosynthesis protein